MVLGLLIVVLVIMICAVTRACMIAKKHGGYNSSKSQMYMQKLSRQNNLTCPVAAEGAIVIDNIKANATQKAATSTMGGTLMANIVADRWLGCTACTLVGASKPLKIGKLQ